MITTAGKDVIIQFFGGQTRHIASAIALGTGATAPALGDTALVAEVARLTVTSISADLANKRIVFKATLPAGLITDPVNELGIFHSDLGTLVARVVLGTPKVVDPNLPTEIEYSLGITV